MKKLGSGYYSVSRVGWRLKRAYERWERLRELYNEVKTIISHREFARREDRTRKLALVKRLREDGAWKFNDIGQKLGVTRQRAIQLYQEAVWQESPMGLMASVKGNGSSPPPSNGESSPRRKD